MPFKKKYPHADQISSWGEKRNSLFQICDSWYQLQLIPFHLSHELLPVVFLTRTKVANECPMLLSTTRKDEYHGWNIEKLVAGMKVSHSMLD